MLYHYDTEDIYNTRCRVVLYHYDTENIHGTRCFIIMMMILKTCTALGVGLCFNCHYDDTEDIYVTQCRVVLYHYDDTEDLYCIFPESAGLNDCHAISLKTAVEVSRCSFRCCSLTSQ